MQGPSTGVWGENKDQRTGTVQDLHAEQEDKSITVATKASVWTEFASCCLESICYISRRLIDLFSKNTPPLKCESGCWHRAQHRWPGSPSSGTQVFLNIASHFLDRHLMLRNTHSLSNSLVFIYIGCSACGANGVKGRGGAWRVLNSARVGGVGALSELCLHRGFQIPEPLRRPPASTKLLPHLCRSLIR